MNVEQTDRGFEVIQHASYGNAPLQERLVQASSVIGSYEDAWQRPGTSALWVGESFHLNREEVTELISHLQAWLDTGSLELPRVEP